MCVWDGDIGDCGSDEEREGLLLHEEQEALLMAGPVALIGIDVVVAPIP